tara:strand:+ start:158 stop:1432 length:1275 start_codon:yes stop_codon:yes gene_type:complete
MNSDREDDESVLTPAASAAPEKVDAELTIAKRCSGGPCLNGAEGEKYTCYGCEKPVHWVKPFVRTVCGIKHNVQGHFRHNKRTGGCSGGEGLFHKAAKDAILTGTGWEFYAKCIGTRETVGIRCDHEIQIDVPQQQKRGEHPFQTYFLDVGMLDSSANVVGAVEVFHTSTMKREKRNALIKAGVAWVEVSAKEVLDVYDANGRGGRVRAVDCAAMQCDGCVLHKQTIDALAREKRVLKEIESEQLARVQAKSVIETQGPQALAEKLAEGSYSLHEDVSFPSRFWDKVITATAQALEIDLEKINVQQQADMARDVVAEQALLEASKASGSNVLSFGKHKGATVALLFDEDETRPYVRWLAGFTGYKECDYNRPEVHNSSAYQYVPTTIAKEAKQLLKGRCLLCFCQTDQEWKNWCASCFRDACHD